LACTERENRTVEKQVSETVYETTNYKEVHFLFAVTFISA